MDRIGWLGFAVLAGMLVVLPGATCVPTIVLPAVEIDDGGETGNNGTPVDGSSFARQVVDLVNQERAAHGLGALAPNDMLAQAAAEHARRMAELNFFAHTDPYNGTQPWDRAQAAGYNFVFIGENIAAGLHTPEEVMEAWMNSPSHRENILREQISEIGVAVYEGGAYGIYWVQVFGEPW